jgi:hypothetical protein
MAQSRPAPGILPHPNVGKKPRILQKVEGIWGVPFALRNGLGTTAVNMEQIRYKSKNVNRQHSAHRLISIVSPELGVWLWSRSWPIVGHGLHVATYAIYEALW